MWGIPPIIKIYEALGTVADNRLKIDGNNAKCFSSTGNKHYDIIYDPQKNAIMTNDNGSYWKDYLGYPAIAFLLQTNILPLRPDLAQLLKGIAWKDINQKFNNDFDKTLSYILKPLDEEVKEKLREYADLLLTKITEMKLQKLGKNIKPPSGY